MLLAPMSLRKPIYSPASPCVNCILVELIAALSKPIHKHMLPGSEGRAMGPSDKPGVTSQVQVGKLRVLASLVIGDLLILYISQRMSQRRNCWVKLVLNN